MAIRQTGVMARKRHLVLALFAALLGCAGNAPKTAAAAACEDQSRPPDDRIAACTTLIDRSKTTGLFTPVGLAWTYSNRGVAWMDKGDRDRALADYNDAIVLNPQFAGAFNNRGSLWNREGDRDRAVADFDRAIQYEPTLVEAYYNRALIEAARGNDDRAVADFAYVVRMRHPLAANAYLSLASLDVKRGDRERALAELNEAVRLDPKSFRPFYRRGLLQYADARFSEAASDFMEASRLNPNYAYSMIWQGLALQRSGQPDAAHEQWLLASRLFADSWPAPVVQFVLGRSDEGALLAAAESQDAKKRTNQRCEAHFYVGQRLILIGNESEAIRYLRIAEAQCPKSFNEYGVALSELRRLGR